jgi:hypothetical protein
MSLTKDLRDIAGRLKTRGDWGDAAKVELAAQQLEPKAKAPDPEPCASDSNGWPPKACPSHAWCAGKGVCDRARGKACRP